MIELIGIKKAFKTGSVETVALNGIDLSIADGDFVALTGPSGSGKSTLLNIIGGIESPTEGVYKKDSTEVSGLNKHKLSLFRKENVSFIFQQYALMEEYTVFENIALPLRIKRIPKKEVTKRVAEIMDSLGIANLHRKHPKALSGGEQQRTAIARALVSGNDMILADEPTGALDSKNGEKVMDILCELHEGKAFGGSVGQKTIIVVTHDNSIAERCDHIVRIADGKIIN